MKRFVFDVSPIVYTFLGQLSGNMLSSINVNDNTFNNIIKEYFIGAIDDCLVTLMADDITLEEVTEYDVFYEYLQSSESLSIIEYPSFSSVIKALTQSVLDSERFRDQLSAMSTKLINRNFKYDLADMELLVRRGSYVLTVDIDV